MAAQAEQTLFTSPAGVRITTSRAIFQNGGRTYALMNITSVKRGLIPNIRDRGWRQLAVYVFIAMLFGLAAILGRQVDVAIGFVCLVAAAGCALYGVLRAQRLFQSRDVWTVRIGTAGGESEAFTSTNFAEVEAIMHALNEAIIGLSHR